MIFIKISVDTRQATSPTGAARAPASGRGQKTGAPGEK